jgi:hypothetical protein
MNGRSTCKVTWLDGARLAAAAISTAVAATASVPFSSTAMLAWKGTDDGVGHGQACGEASQKLEGEEDGRATPAERRTARSCRPIVPLALRTSQGDGEP